MFAQNAVVEYALRDVDANTRLVGKVKRMQVLIARRWGTDDKRERAKLRVKINRLHDAILPRKGER